MSDYQFRMIMALFWLNALISTSDQLLKLMCLILVFWFLCTSARAKYVESKKSKGAK